MEFRLKSDMEELSRWTAAGSGRSPDDHAWYRPALGSKKELQCGELARLKEAFSNRSCKSGSRRSCRTHTWDVRTTLAAHIHPCLSNAALLVRLMRRFVTFGRSEAVWKFAFVESGRSGTFFLKLNLIIQGNDWQTCVGAHNDLFLPLEQSSHELGYRKSSPIFPFLSECAMCSWNRKDFENVLTGIQDIFFTPVSPFRIKTERNKIRIFKMELQYNQAKILKLGVRRTFKRYNMLHIQWLKLVPSSVVFLCYASFEIRCLSNAIVFK